MFEVAVLEKVNLETETETSGHTQFIENERVGLNALAKFVRFTADQNWNIVSFSHQRHLRSSDTGHDVSIR